MANGEMGRDPGRLRQEMKEKIRRRFLDAGVIKAGFAKAGEIDAGLIDDMRGWIGKGFHGEMEYLERHVELKRHTNSVFPGANTVISLAFGYGFCESEKPGNPLIASYAAGNDYHDVLRKILNPVVKSLQKEFGGRWRICVDSAPVAERYFAIKAGIGVRGLNGNVIVDEAGGYCVLAEVLSTLELEPDEAGEKWCGGCKKCLDICPGKALSGDGTMDARKCINYLTIEKKSGFSDSDIEILRKKGGSLFGCDLCLKVCPHNNILSPPFCPEGFKGRSEIMELSPVKLLEMDEEEFKRKFSNSPLIYAGYGRLLRNAQISNMISPSQI